jgi:ATP-dependent helicase/DNAse subunit B
LEQAFGMDGAPPLILSDGRYDIRLIGRIDRIDTAQDGRFIVYDYKKGKSTPDANDIADGMDFQLPVYIWAAGKMLEHEGYMPAGAAYYSIEGAGLGGMMAKKDSGINTPRQRKGVLDDKEWDDMLERLKHELFEHFDSIMCGVYPKQPKKCPLRDAYNGGFCDFTNICNA